MPSGWRLLRHSSVDTRIPPLLVKHEFGVSNYKIWITDLTNIWAETLNQRPLVQRAWEIDSDIDPIEVDQREMLLRNIKDALYEVKGTKLLLSNEPVSNRLILKARCSLPKPLKPLVWPFHLVLESHNTLTNEFVLPLLAQQLTTRNQVSSLLAIIKDKDHVIGKLTDRMQSEGTDISKVFPSAASSKHGSRVDAREHLAKSVPGLGNSDEDKSQFQGPQELDVPRNPGEVLCQLSAHGGGFASFSVGQQSDMGNWWENLGAGEDLVADEKQSYFEDPPQHSIDNQFQRQTMPEQLKKPASSGHPLPRQMILPDRGSNPENSAPVESTGNSSTDASDDESHTENGDLDALQPTTATTKSPVKQDSSSKSPSPPPSASGPTQNPVSKPKSMLGRIGGATKPDVSPVKSKLGHIGGAAGQTATSHKLLSKSPELRGRSSKKNRSPSPPRETSQERADRKREMLKRELEEKSKAGVKKKRKF
ncbi:MAG: hypothetical protein Q9218_002453 [Villophora microphyllina]